MTARPFVPHVRMVNNDIHHDPTVAMMEMMHARNHNTEFNPTLAMMDMDRIRDNISTSFDVPLNGVPLFPRQPTNSSDDTPNKKNEIEKNKYMERFTQKLISLNPQNNIITHTKHSENYLYTLNDYLISTIILFIPNDIHSLYNTSKRLRNIIQLHPICNAVNKYGITEPLYECAVNSNNFDFVKYVYDNHCHYYDFPDNQLWYKNAPQPGCLCCHTDENIELNKTQDLCFIAFKNGNDKIFNFLCDHRFPLTRNFGEYVALNGNSDMLKVYCTSNGKIHSTLYMNVIMNGHYDCLKILIDNDKKESNVDLYNLCSLAISNGHIKCLEYLVGQKFDIFDEMMCLEAIRKKQWVCVKYLLEHACPFNFNTVVSLCRQNNEMMHYLKKNEDILKKNSFLYKYNHPM